MVIEIKNIKKILEKKYLRQSFFLYLAILISTLLGITVSILNTRVLGPDQYDNFVFIQLVVLTFMMSLTFGLFNSGSRIIASDTEEDNTQSVMAVLYLLVFSNSRQNRFYLFKKSRGFFLPIFCLIS